MKNPVVKYIMQANRVDNQSHQCICAPASGITEGLYRHDLSERRVKKIQYRCYLLFHNEAQM